MAPVFFMRGSQMNLKTAMILAALLTIASAAPAVAQGLAEGEITEQLLVCDDVIDLTERLTCFNAIVDKLKSVLAVPAVKSPPASVSVSEAPVVASAVKNPPASVSASDAPVVAPPVSPEIDDFGSEGIASRSTPEEESSAVEKIEATIVRSWKNHDGRFSVELDNGQIWRETQGTKSRLPKVNTSVTISTGRLGGYRMKFENINKLAWVRRTK